MFHTSRMGSFMPARGRAHTKNFGAGWVSAAAVGFVSGGPCMCFEQLGYYKRHAALCTFSEYSYVDWDDKVLPRVDSADISIAGSMSQMFFVTWWMFKTSQVTTGNTCEGVKC